MGASYLSIRISPATVKRSQYEKQRVILDYTKEEEQVNEKQIIAIDTAQQEEGEDK